MTGFGDLRFLTLAGGLLVLLALAHALAAARRRAVLERLGDAPRLRALAASVSPGRRAAKAILGTAGVVLVALAAARPQGRDVGWKQRGIDVVIAVDVSASMLARDAYPSRLDRARALADAVLTEFAGDRVGVVVFGGASAAFPLGQDAEAARALYHGIAPGDAAPGSDLGEALRAARCLLRPDVVADPECRRERSPRDETSSGRLLHTDLGERGRAIVLLSDGEETVATSRARAEAEKAAALGIEVFAVGIGATRGELIPEVDASGREVGYRVNPDGSGFVVTRLDEALLVEIARVAGGDSHYLADDPRRFDPAPLLAGLRRVREGDYAVRAVDKPREAYAGFLFAAFLLLVIEACLPERRRR